MGPLFGNCEFQDGRSRAFIQGPCTSHRSHTQKPASMYRTLKGRTHRSSHVHPLLTDTSEQLHPLTLFVSNGAARETFVQRLLVKTQVQVYGAHRCPWDCGAVGTHALGSGTHEPCCSAGSRFPEFQTSQAAFQVLHIAPNTRNISLLRSGTCLKIGFLRSTPDRTRSTLLGAPPQILYCPK